MAAKQGISREALETLSKDELVTRAEALGIDGARKFTRVELVDEITRAVGVPDRGLLGRARDLLRGVVERGLARGGAPAPVIPRDDGELAPPAPVDPAIEPPVATVTLAEIYLAQGHLARARAILREVLRHEPNDESARVLLDRLDRRAVSPRDALHEGERPEASVPGVMPGAMSEPRVPPEPGALPDDPYAAIGLEPEAFVEPEQQRFVAVPPMLDDVALPARYDVDECVAMAVDPTTIYVYWEARRSTVERARRVLGRSSALAPVGALRVLVVEPDTRGPRVSTRDFEVIDVEYGEWFVRELPAGSIVRAAIGLRVGDRFVPLAHTHDIEAPPATPSHAIAHEVVFWREDPSSAEPVSPAPAHPVARAATPLARDAGTLGLPPLPLPPGEDEAEGRGLSSAELARRQRVERARAAARAAGPAPDAPEALPRPGASEGLIRPGSASWLHGR
ncbi:MAG: DUF4912 domain-containing protein [Deltaproteobacteria bacterium]|nr:DUF4912 domain-containing protein [Deltaproteobacteria bacterium]